MHGMILAVVVAAATVIAGCCEQNAPLDPMGEAPDLLACETDADCTTTMRGNDCCLSYCVGHPISKKAYEWRKKKLAKCEDPKGCPPPAPCPIVDYTVAAKCVESVCVAERVPKP